MSESRSAPVGPTPASRTAGTASEARPSRRPGRKRAGLVYLAASAALLIALYASIDTRQVASSLARADRPWLAVSVAMILPITVLRAVRFLWVAPRGALSGVVEALRLTLVSTALNLFLPAKSGDLIKSYVVARGGQASPGVAVSVIVYERLCDVFSLTAWCVLAWLVGRPHGHSLPSLFWPAAAGVATFCGVLITSDRASQVPRIIAGLALRGGRLRKLQELASGWPDLMASLWGRRGKVVLFSLALWLTHLTQIWMFTIALSARIPFAVCVSLTAVALMAGQLPLTIAGLGARDVALVVLMAGYMPAESAAALGVLMATRNLLPPLLGAPFMRSYLSTVVADARRWQQASTRADA